jgi:hypothetical protein
MDKKIIFQILTSLCCIVLAFVFLNFPYLIYKDPIINVYENSKFYLRCDLIQNGNFIDYVLFKECQTQQFLVTPDCFNPNYMKNIYMPGSINCSATHYLENTYKTVDSLRVNYCAMVFWMFLVVSVLIFLIPFIYRCRKEADKFEKVASYNMDTLTKTLWDNQKIFEKDEWDILVVYENKAKLTLKPKDIDVFGQALGNIMQEKEEKNKGKPFEL